MADKTIHVRALREDDEPAWRDMWAGYQAFYEVAIPEEVTAVNFRRLVNEDGMHGLIAEKDGTPLGIVHFLFHSDTWRTTKTCYLQDLFTTPEARGQGVARALIAHVYARADAVGCPSVYWLTAEDNKTARALYDQVADLTPFRVYERPEH